MTDTTMTERADDGFDPETGARDMIDLSGSAEAPSSKAQRPVAPSAPGADDARMAEITEAIVKALKTVYDPEIPVDIYELGLIYKVDYEDPGNVMIEMTLTAPGCPVAGEMPGWVEQAVARVDGIESVKVEMTFEPPWTPDRMSDEAKLELGWM